MLEHTMVEGASNLFRLEPGSVAPPFVAALRSGALLARVDAAVLTLAGPGAVTCVPGLLTNDIEQPGGGAFVYGALLTPKGMIVVDGWAGRLGTTVSYTVPAEGRERALGIFTHSVPPRLARVSDRTPDVAVYRLAGPRALAIAATAGLGVPPAPGRVLEDSPPGVQTARGGDAAPFVVQLTAPPRRAGGRLERGHASGPRRGSRQERRGGAGAGRGGERRRTLGRPRGDPRGSPPRGDGARRRPGRAGRGPALRPAGGRPRLKTKSPGAGPGHRHCAGRVAYGFFFFGDAASEIGR